MKEVVRYCFIILHYGPVSLTQKAVRSIQKLPGEDKVIIVVDNGTNEAAGALQSFPGYNDHIHVVESDVNLGFSKGNNLGFAYAKDNYDFDFLIVINNDIIFNDKSFLSVLTRCYNETPFYVAGPDIYTPSEVKHVNPYKTTIMTVKNMTEMINIFEKKKDLFVKGESSLCQTAYKRMKRSHINRYVDVIKMVFKKEKQWKKGWLNVVLQGSCLIFDKRYCNVFDKLFEPEVFLYGEEYFLAYKCMKKGFTTAYLPELHALHTHKGSYDLNNMTYKDYCDKRVDMYEQLLVSGKEYIDYVSRQEGKG